MMKKLLLLLIILVFILAGCAGQHMRSGPSVADQMAEGEASANSYDVNTTPDSTADYLLGIDAYAGSWAVQRFDIRYVTHQDPISGTAANFASTCTGKCLYGGVYRVTTTTGTIELPPWGPVMRVTIISEIAGATLSLNPDDTGTEDTFIMNGLAAVIGENLEATVVGAMCVLEYAGTADYIQATCNGFTEATPP